MEKKKKRKRKEPKQKATRSDNVKDPFPSHTRPTPHDCEAVRDTLLALHPIPPELAKYRKPNHTSEPVLDGLVRTVLSQNTTDANSQRAFASLKSSFPTWEQVLVADSKDFENAIRCGGLAPTKASCIKNVLRSLRERTGHLCLEYLRHLSVDQVKSELSLFKGIGPKTVACVLMFNLQQDDFPVDTHIFEIAKTMGWVPAVADRNKSYLHLNQRIPNELKFDLNCLMYTHGKLCRKCSGKKGNQQVKKCDDNSCPLLKYCTESD
ncbi:hypothetical protein VNO78_23859 [Psophocarpus tetragonolobus]|uniref:HhH-GPD domain-containing protein n=1 Tax=Psophocarpus tetragonolobus TaxID=3891 RepID=A0AAN9S7H6_PSOTE